MPRAIKIIAPAVIEIRSAAKTFATRGCSDIISSLKAPILQSLSQDGTFEKQLKRPANDCTQQVQLIYIPNIGDGQQITPNFAENFAIYCSNAGKGGTEPVKSRKSCGENTGFTKQSAVKSSRTEP